MEIRIGRDPHGRTASAPSEIPKRGWRDVLFRVKDSISRDNLFIIAAGVAYSVFFAIFPGIAAMVSVLGLVLKPADVERLVSAAGGTLPPDALSLITNQVHELVSTGNQALGIGLVVSVGLALWSAASGMKALMTALNVAYKERESRGFFRYYGTSLVLTLGGVVFFVVTLALVAGLPAVLQRLPLPDIVVTLLGILRWVILAAAMLFSLAVLYRYGSSRRPPKWHWVSWGAVLATLLWLGGSALFSLYVTKFGDYNKTYGALAAIVILLTWIYLTVSVVLLGAELNAELEHQTRVDSTDGKPKPMGQRGARMADTVGESR